MDSGRLRAAGRISMNKTIVMAVMAAAAVASTAAPARAQGPDVSMKGQYEMAKGWITKAAAMMPEADYGFKPTPEVRSFGQVLGHIANAVGMMCSAPAGAKSPLTGSAEKLVTKAEITKALDDAFAACDKSWAALTPAWNTETIDFFGRTPTKMAVITFNTSHAFEHYGNLVTYLRLKGHVPPSSQGGM
jgi:uncharacterized damage-inducible protein DinB